LIKLGIQYDSYINIYIDPLDISKISEFKNMLKMLDDSTIEVLTYSEYLIKYNQQKSNIKSLISG